MQEHARLSLDYGETVISAGSAKRFYSPVFSKPFEEGHAKIPPKEDFVLSTIPTKDLNASGFNSRQPIAISEARVGESVFFLGFPRHKKYNGQMQFGTGKVLENGLVKTNVPYDMNVEFIVEINGFIQNLDEIFGFSGGPVFNQNGAYLGTMVRANQNGLGKTYLRVVRGSYIFNSVRNAIKALPKNVWQSHIDVLTFPR